MSKYQLKKNRCRTSLLLALVFMLNGCGESIETESINLGDPFPVTQVERLDGTWMNVNSLRGKVIVFHLWASWCAPCRKELPAIENLIGQLDPDRFTFVGLSVDEDLNLLKEFKLKYAVTFAKYVDPKRVIAEGVLGVTAYPDTFVVDQSGYFVRRITGENKWDSLEMIALLEDIYQQGVIVVGTR